MRAPSTQSASRSTRRGRVARFFNRKTAVVGCSDRPEALSRLGWKRPRSEMLWKEPILPLAFSVSSRSCIRGKCRPYGFYRVRGGMAGVPGHVGGSGSVTRGPRGGPCRRVIRGASGSVGGDCGGARLAARYLAACPRASRFERLARPVIFRAVLLKVCEHVLRAVGGPEHQCPAVMFVGHHAHKPIGVVSWVKMPHIIRPRGGNAEITRKPIRQRSPGTKRPAPRRQGKVEAEMRRLPQRATG